MEGIKVGEYIKTVAGYIGKIISYNDGMYTAQMKDVIIDLYIDDIKNHKENLIDLIEEGDYVNGLYVHGITDYGLQVYMFGDSPEILEENEIKNIVTKEQFNQVKYEV